MTRQERIAAGVCAVMFLSVSLAPRTTRADKGNSGDDRPIRLYGATSTGPIGRVADSALNRGTLVVNDRDASVGQAIWSGDMIQSRGSSRASLLLDSIGEIALSKGAAVRIATGHLTLDDGARGLALIASLSRGEISVKLERAAGAYLRVAGSEYACSNGADFVASVVEGRASIVAKSGDVRVEEQTSQHQYTIRPVGHGSNIRVPAGGLRKLQVQVLEDDKPVAGVGVMFVLDTSGAVIGLLGLGTLSGTTANVVTDADGMTAVQFVARNTSGSSPISATVEGTRVAWTGQITVTSKGVSRGTGWTIFALIGAGAAAGIAYALTREKDPLRAQPPVVKNP